MIIKKLIPDKFFLYFKKNRFAKNVSILVGGTGFAQLLVIGASPIVTRLYTPEDFGTLAIFISLLAILGTAASFKYQFAIPLPEKDEDAIQVLAISLFFNILYSIICGVALFLAIPLIEKYDNYAVVIPFLWILPISIIALGIYQSFKYWAIREKKFKHIAQTKISQNIALIAAQIGIGSVTTGPIGLLIGDAIGRSGGSTTLAIQAWKKVRSLRKEITIERMKKQATRYKRFPLYSSGSGLVNSLGLQMTPLLIAGILGPVVAGLYALTQRVSGAPMRLIGESFGLVYYKEAADSLKLSKRELRSLFLRHTKTLFIIGLVPVTILLILGPKGFAFIFGDNWAESGLYAQILAPMLLLQFVVVPLSQTLNIIERQDLQLIWDIARFVSVAMVFAGLHYFSIKEPIALMWLSLIMTLLYFSLFIITFVQIKKE
ncbi:MAG: lipopolysaccharide biosynthesis protein [bacterium]